MRQPPVGRALEGQRRGILAGLGLGGGTVLQQRQAETGQQQHGNHGGGDQEFLADFGRGRLAGAVHGVGGLRGGTWGNRRRADLGGRRLTRGTPR
jgi:hypothetical protein